MNYPKLPSFRLDGKRALVTGANALSITGWEEKDGITTFTGHFFDCHSKKGL